MAITLGIDLGTTYSAMAYQNADGDFEILPNREGERITPSVVLFDDLGPMVGSMAKSAAADNPLNVSQFVKRQMGERKPAFRSESGETYTPEEVSALILKRLKEDAEETLGEPVTQAVITVPAYFNDAQRKATEDAGKIAGLNVLRVINEPTAAALAYGMGRNDAEETAVVYDLGGGTFDVTIMTLSSSGVTVKASGGDANLGGFDWDNELISLLLEKALGDDADEAFGDAHLMQDLREKAEVAKRTLSSREAARIMFRHEGQTHRVEVTRTEFSKATQKLLNRTGRILKIAAEDAGVTWEGIDKILLVGGSTRMPDVASYVESLTGIKPSKELHPDEVVAIGAAVQATLLDERPGLPQVFEVKDVCSHSLGMIANRQGTDDAFNSIIMPKDTPIPGSLSQEYTTVQDGQRQLRLRVTQGESEDVDAALILGESTIDLPPYPKGAPIKVTFAYDDDGIVHVSVFDLTANQDLGEMFINRESNLAASEVAVMEDRMNAVTVN